MVCVVLANIEYAESREWYYKSCKICYKKVNPNKDGEYECEQCKGTQPILRLFFLFLKDNN